MEIRNLITFIHVAELNSFTKAASLLGYTQSTVSFQIKQLESELDCLLFERINHTISLTDRGKELLKYAHEISILTDRLRENMQSKTEPYGKIHFVAPDSVCEDMLLKNYISFHNQYPQINLICTNADTLTAFSMLDKNEVDAVITLDEHNYQMDYVIEKEEPVPMHFIAGKASPFSKRKNIKIAELAGAPFVLTEKNMGYRRVLDNELAKISVEITPVLEVGRTDIITTLIEQTDMVSYLPDFLTREKVRSGSIVYLDVVDFKTDIWKQLIYHKNKWKSRCMSAFLDFVKENQFSGDM